MAAIVTDQFRINNAGNFLGDVTDPNNSYYIFVGLSNPGIGNTRFGRSTSVPDWNGDTPNPTDNFNYLNHVKDTMIYGKKITTDNIRRVIKKKIWEKGTTYEMYRHDYSSSNKTPITDRSRLYEADYYVMNKDYNVYICIDNGSTGINSTGNSSQNEPTLTGLEPFKPSGDTNDGYVWKYLFSVSPSDVIKFDATEFIPIPNSWSSNTDSQVVAIRENGDSDVNNNQIKKVFIQKSGKGYSGGTGQEFKLVGDGTGGKVIVDVNQQTEISDVKVSVGGKGYTYAMVDLDTIDQNVSESNKAELIPIIPPSKGHGFDPYKELGADRVLVYARFDTSTKDFPPDTKFSQIGIVKNPLSIGSTQIYNKNQYSSTGALYLNSFPEDAVTSINVGDIIVQDTKNNSGVVIGQAKAYVTSFDLVSDNPKIGVLKYYQDRSLYFNQLTGDQTDYSGITSTSGLDGRINSFQLSATADIVKQGAPSYTLGINTSFSGITTNPTGSKVVELGIEFTKGIAPSEINNQSGDIIYLDNRPLITRDERQKEDVKVILEF